MGYIAETAVKVTADTKGFHAQAQSGVMSSVTRIAAGAAAAIGGLAIGKALFVDPIKSAGDFQKSLNVLQATSHATNAQMKQISATAMRLGADVKLPAVSASDAANAMLELAKGGFTAKQSMEAARGVLLLSTAAEIDGADAARLVADGLHAFGMRATEASVLVDDFAGAANASTASMSEVGMSLQQSGQAFHQLGIPVGDAATAIAAMANAGIKGSDAGTSLKTMLMRLSPQTKQAKQEFKDMNIDVFDQQGKFIGLDKTIQQFAPKLQAMTQEQRAHALQVIFGSDASRAANIILGTSAKRFDALRDKVTKAGQAQKLADAQTKGFNGAMQALHSAVENLQLKIGLALLPRLSQFVRFLGRIASAPNLKVAISIAWKGVTSMVADLGKAISDMLFGSSSSHQVVSRGMVRVGREAVTIDPGLVAALGDMLAAQDWSSVGKSVGDAISNAIHISTKAIEDGINNLMAAVTARKDQIAEVGLVIGLTMLSKLLDPGFWVAHWQLIGGIALSAITILFPEGRLAQIGLRAMGFLLKPFSMLGVRLLALGTEAVLSFSGAIERGVGSLGGKIALWIGDAILRATSAGVNAMVNLGAKIITAIINKVTTLNVLFRTAIFTAIVTVIGTVIGAAVSKAGELASGVANGILSVIQKLAAFGSRLAAAVVGAVHGIIGGAKGAGESVASAIANGIKSAAGKLAGLAGDLAGRIQAAVSQVAGSAFSMARQIGFAIADGAISGIGNLAGRLGSAIAGAVSSAIHIGGIIHHGSGPWQSTIHLIGKPMADGIVEGFEKQSVASRPRLLAALNKMGDDLANASKKQLPKIQAAYKQWAEGAKAAFDAQVDSVTKRVEASFTRAQASLDRWKAKLTPAEFTLAQQRAAAEVAKVRADVSAAAAALNTLPAKQAAAWSALLAQQQANMAALRATLQSTTDDALLAGNTFNKSMAKSATDPLATQLIAAQQAFDAVKAQFDQGLVAQAVFIQAANALDDAKLAASEDTNATTLLDQYNTWQTALAQQTAAGAAITTQQYNDQVAQQEQQATNDAETLAAQDALHVAEQAQADFNLQKLAEKQRAAKDAEYERLSNHLKSMHDRTLAHVEHVQHIWDLHYNELARMATKGGDNIGDNLADALRRSIPTVAAAAAAVAQAISNNLKVRSPTREGPMSDLNHWWDRLGPTLVEGFDGSQVQAALHAAVTPPSAAGGYGRAGQIRTSGIGETWSSARMEMLLERIEKHTQATAAKPDPRAEVHIAGSIGIDASTYRARR